MAHADAATGALIAGRRIERGIPHYLDTLEQVSLIVLSDGEAHCGILTESGADARGPAAAPKVIDGSLVSSARRRLLAMARHNAVVRYRSARSCAR
jgi:hypothetical protein